MLFGVGDTTYAYFEVEKADSRAPLSFQPAWSKLRTHHVSRISELF